MKKSLLPIFATAGLLLSCSNLKTLPAPETIDGYWSMFNIDKHINVFGTLDDYLFRDDIVYRDMRMLVDPAQYEQIGGDRFLSGFVDGFSVTPYPYIAPVYGLPPEVGSSYEGPHLFDYDGQSTYTANYAESQAILLELFPQDKTIFVMCGGGGYAMMMKNMLVSLGWDADKIYNVGCYWSYSGDHDIKIKEGEGEEAVYHFHRVDYKVIDLSYLTPLDA